MEAEFKVMPQEEVKEAAAEEEKKGIPAFDNSKADTAREEATIKSPDQ